ncbi:Xre family transcriptional regulator [Desulfitobacterium sp. LBE]|uniref:Transcriptional regulator, XRE family n=1 Tax=Desulfitobacterium chlororespirans DSM 11544 TaxID=1121395 RepID=A0A1M7TRJ3_9FIRM|nr:MULTISPECIES: helix-turn-helix transcriptional regulator [Desulfitobacterium]TWH60290.1 Xre family transcriptional regulator [Desulfitobacterium sp. LBE]SHN73369.1 transcriptional regulator, XRE family [Desulfitobacterium chlororespirans DSM 11544]
MSKSWDINDKRFIQIGLKIAYYRKLNEMTQDQLAERIGITSKYLSQVETPSCVQPISLKTLFAIADLFHVPPHKFLEFDKD